MVNWSSTEEIAADAAAFTRLEFVLVGIYLWEFVISIDFDLSFLRGTRSFRWPMVFYFVNRYLLLACMIVLCAVLSITKPIACQPIFSFLQVSGNMASGLASINLCIRTMAIWSQNKWIIVPLIILILGHWSIILQGSHLFATWIPEQGCVITSTKTNILIAQFIYSMILDLIVLLLSAWKLLLPRTYSSKLVSVLFRDGLAYFIVAFLGNLLVVVFELLDLNPVMNSMFNTPSVVIGTIAATRAVRNLANHLAQPAGVQFLGNTRSPTTQDSSVCFGAGNSRRLGLGHSTVLTGTSDTLSGVHVHMDTLKVTDHSQAIDPTTGGFDKKITMTEDV